jgi:hypothetical protein
MWDEMKTWSYNKAKKQFFCNKDESKDLHYFKIEQMIAKIRNLLHDIPKKLNSIFFHTTNT